MKRAGSELTLTEAAATAGYSVTSLYRYINSGDLATVRRGRRHFVPRESLHAWLRSRNELPASELEAA